MTTTSTAAIWKFPLFPKTTDTVSPDGDHVLLPAGTEPLHVDTDPLTGQPVLWARVNPDDFPDDFSSDILRTARNEVVRLYGTGWPLPAAGRYVGTIVDCPAGTGLVWHAFHEPVDVDVAPA